MEKRLLHDYVTVSSTASIASPLCLNRLWVMQDQPPMTSETVYSVELVSRMTYLCANSLRGTYTGTLRRNVPSIPVSFSRVVCVIFSTRLHPLEMVRRVSLKGTFNKTMDGPRTH